MSGCRQGAAFALEDRFDAAHLVSSLRKAGWSVRRLRLREVSGRVVDTSTREMLQAGLAAVEYVSAGRKRVELWLFPRKHTAPRCVLAKDGCRLSTPALLRERTALPLNGGVETVVSFSRKSIPFDIKSSAGAARLLIETENTGIRGGSPRRSVAIEIQKGPDGVLSLLSGLVRLERGIGDQTDPSPAHLLEAHGVTCGPVTAYAAPCGRKSDAVSVACAIIRANSRNLRALEAGARLGLDAEYVHEMRVATRRMRAALRMFAAAFIKEPRARLNAELRWAGGLLAEVRDLDVYIEAVPHYLSYIEADLDDYAFFLDELRIKRQRARETMLAALDSDRYAAFLGRVDEFVANPPASGASIDLDKMSSAGLKKFAAEVLEAGGKVRSDQDLHDLRISFKRLRYAVEFLRGLSPKRMAKVAKTAAKYQDILGRFNDAGVACQNVRHAVEEEGRDSMEIFLLGYLYACQRLRGIETRQEFLRLWRGKGPRKLAAAVEAARDKL